MEKRRKIFDDGVTVTEEVSVKNKKKPGLTVNDGSTTNYKSPVRKTIKVEDVIDTFAGYLPTQFNFMPRDGGQCLLCGKETISSMRKICVDCLKKRGKEIYQKARNFAEIGDNEFDI